MSVALNGPGFDQARFLSTSPIDQPTFDSLVADPESTGFEGINTMDWQPNTSWAMETAGANTITWTFTSPLAVTGFALFGHNLGDTGATVRFQYEDSGWVDLFTPITKGDNKTIYQSFTPVAFTQYRILIEDAEDCNQIAVIAFGQELVMPIGQHDGFSPPVLARNQRILNSRSETGNFLDRQRISSGSMSTVQFRNIDETFVRDSWLPFQIEAELHPFFYSWRHQQFPNEAALGWTSGSIPKADYSNHVYMNCALGSCRFQDEIF